MKSYKILCLQTILCLGIVSISFAQPAIEFEETSHSFGEITEGTQAVHEFSFTNTGNQPLVISRVQASCGCTTPFWTQEPVMPGEKGIIKASYNSQGRPGQFRKSITVMSNAGNANAVVFIQGTVTQRPPSAAEIAASSKIVVANTTQKVGKVEKGQTIPVTYKLTNSGKGILEIRNVRSNCNCVFFGPDFERTLGSGESGELTLYYTPQETGNWVEVLTLYTNDVTNGEMQLVINSEVVESLADDGVVSPRRGF